VADPFWPIVHAEARVPLPALPEFAELLEAGGRSPSITMLERERRRFAERDQLEGFLRRQLWIADGGEKERLFKASFAELVIEHPDARFGLAGETASPIGIVTWAPPEEGEAQ
jgi:hypothetical protein